MKESRQGQKDIEYYIQLPYSILLHEIEDDGVNYWIAEIPELSGCKSHGSTIDEAVKDVREAQRDWILDSLEEGNEIPVPIERDRFSGKTLVRMSRSLHRALSLMAESEKLSLNQLIVTILAKDVGRLGVLNRVEEKLDDLLNKVNDVLEYKELALTPSLNVFSQIVEPDKEEGYQIMVDTSIFGGACAVTGARTVWPGQTTPATAGTTLSFDELSLYHPSSHRKPRFDHILLASYEGKESESEDATELKPK